MQPTYTPEAGDYINKDEIRSQFLKGVTAIEACKRDHSKDKFKKGMFKKKSKVVDWEAEF
jgi:hypothetical protein